MSAHADNASVIRHSVKGGVDFDTALSELRFDVVRNFNICAVNIRDFFISVRNLYILGFI